MRLHAIDVAADDLIVLAEADLIVLAAPVRQNIELLQELDENVRQPAIITDTGSTKRDVVAAAATLPPRFTFIGGHPLAGAAQGGLERARPDLFEGRPWILTTQAATDHSAPLEKLSAFVRALGAEPRVMAADAHDRLLAYLSHLPQLTASALMQVVGDAVGQDGLSLAGRGLADTTRLAASPDDIWKDIAASSENCIGTECPRYQDCFVTRMRQRAAESDLVIVNHHLLFADAAVRQGAYGEVIPDCDAAVLDEAHQLEDVATQYFGVTVSNYRAEDLARDAERMLARWPDPDRREPALRIVERIRDRAERLFARLEPPRRGAGDERARVTPEALTDAQEPGRALIGSLEGLEAAIQLLKDLPPETTPPPGALDDLLAVGARSGSLRVDLTLLLNASDPDYVFFLETRGRGIFFRAAPIDVSAIVREHLLDRFKTTVLTSATLAVDGSFDYLRSRLGIRRAVEVRLPSEFDYATQAVLYLPKRMPSPKDHGYAEAVARECVELLSRSEGRAFVLFTSYAMLRAVEPVLAMKLDYPLLVQGRAPRSALLAEFRMTPHAVLLATSSFWQGVDVVGDALSCVIIDKLPFASPGDPVTAARMEALNMQGGDSFGEYQVPLAILALLQGLGRLIRHRNDRGVLAILDPRLRTMGYGRRFLASMPPAPVTHDLDAVSRFFAH